jgi:hypothetical protein
MTNFKKYRHRESGEIVEVKPVSQAITKTTDQYYSIIGFTNDEKRITKFKTEYQLNQEYEEVKENE